MPDQASQQQPPAPPPSPPQPPPPPQRQRSRARMFETRSHAWREAGLLRQVSPGAVRRARIETLLLVPIFAGIVVVYERYGRHFFETNRPFGYVEVRGGVAYAHTHPLGTLVQVAVAVLLLALGWVIARAAGRAFGPALFRRMEPATAGTVGFLIRLLTLIATVIVALSIAGVNPQTLAVGGAVTAVILGLAAQQTLGNVIAGTVLLSARPFRVGDRVRLQGSMLGGPIEGVVSALGLFYTTFAQESDTIMIPNSVALNALVVIGDGSRGDAGAPGGGAATVAGGAGGATGAGRAATVAGGAGAAGGAQGAQGPGGPPADGNGQQRGDAPAAERPGPGERGSAATL